MPQVQLSNGTVFAFRVTVGTLARLPDSLSLDALLRGLQQGHLQAAIKLMQALHVIAGVKMPAEQWLDQLTPQDITALSQAFVEELERFFRQFGGTADQSTPTAC